MELKFRAWHKEKNIMSDEFSFYDFDVEYFIPKGWSFRHMIIMQHTGLTDKSGKEIFEGDIVKSVLLDPQVREVKFINGRFVFVSQSYWADAHNFFRECEIIGSVYENPELLGGVK